MICKIMQQKEQKQIQTPEKRLKKIYLLAMKLKNIFFYNQSPLNW